MFKNLEFYRELPSPLVIPISGGRSSAYQAAHIIEANGGVPNGAIFTFQNTGFELPETYDFLAEFERFFSIDVVRLERDSDAPTKVKIVSHENLSRNGEPMKRLFATPIVRKDKSFGLRPLPNPVQRTCSSELKTKTSHRYVRNHLNWPNRYWTALGYRADEPKRVERRIKAEVRYVNSSPEGGWGVYPMFHAGVCADHVFDFWSKMPFDLRIESYEGNCDLCFMKAEWKIKDMMLQRPERVSAWLEFEAFQRDRSNRFRKDRRSLAELWEEVRRGNMEAQPQDPFIECGSCTGDFVEPEESDEVFSDLI